MLKGVLITVLGLCASIHFGLLWFRKGFLVEWVDTLKPGFDFNEGLGLFISLIAVGYGVIEILLHRKNSSGS